MKHPIVISSVGLFVVENHWQGILSRALKNPHFAVQLAQAMTAPIRETLDYQGIARKALLVTPMDEKK